MSVSTKPGHTQFTRIRLDALRVEIGHKPGVFRGTGGSNPVPSSGESSELRFRAHTLQGQGERRDPSLSVAVRM